MPGTIFTSLPQFLLVSAIVMVAQTIYVLFGFGAGLIAVGSLALVLPDVKDVVVMLLLVNVPAESWVVYRSRDAIDWRGTLRIAIGVVVGIPVGTAILRVGEPTVILYGLGAVLVVVGAIFARLPDGHRVSWPRWVAPPVGAVSGILTGLFGTGGPPLIIYYRLSGMAKSAFRGNLMAIFFLKTFIRLPAYVIGGLVTAPRLWSGLALLPAVFLGAYLGNRIHITLAEATFRRLVSGLLTAIGLVLLARRLLS